MPNVPDRISWAVDLLGVKPDDRILEVGCGNGAAVSLIAPRLTTGTVTAIDRSPKAIARAGSVNEGRVLSGQARCLTTTLQEFSREGGMFGKVFAVNVNDFWLHPERELPAVLRLLEPGGLLLLELEAPLAARVREFATTMPGHLEDHGFGDITAINRNDTTASIMATRLP